MAEKNLPDGWIKCMSKKFKQIYYFNTQTNETSWVHPLIRYDKKVEEKKEEVKSKKKKKKKKKEEKASKEVPKQSKKIISKTKDKPSSDRKLSARDLVQLGTTPRKRAEKVALWAESVAVKPNIQQVDGKKPNTENSLKSLKNKVSFKDDVKVINKIHETTKVAVETKKTKVAKPIEHSKDFQQVPGYSSRTPVGKESVNVFSSNVQHQQDSDVPEAVSSNENPFAKSLLENYSEQYNDVPVCLAQDLHIIPETSKYANGGFTQYDRQQQQHVIQNQYTAEQTPEEMEESMDVDDAVEFSREIMKEIRDLRSDNTVERPVLNQVVPMEMRNVILTDPLYIVIDTNILLAHLKFVNELKDYPIPGIGAPILYIPWMVLQELDSLKDAQNRYHTQKEENGEEKSYKLHVFARNAIKFINTCLQGEHPRVKGEGAIEAGTPIEGFIEESNDDGIIHAALSLKLRACHSNVVMFSNDRNLCNKAMIAGIKAFSQQNIMLGIRSLFQSGTVAMRKENYEEYYDAYKIQEVIAQRRKQADELSCELQCIVREGLSLVIETEMKTAYGEDLWLQIVKIRPPWTLQDVLTLLERHWIAVFGHIVERSLHKVIEELRKRFQSIEGSTASLETTKVLIELSLTIFTKFSNHSSYDDMMTKCLAASNVLLDKCQEYIRDTAPKQPELPPATATTTKSPLVDSNMVESEIPQEKEKSPHDRVLETFDAIWKTVTHYSALIFNSLNFPSQLIKELDPNEPKPHPKDATACLMIMTSCLLNLIGRIQDVIRIPVERLGESEQFIVKLLEGINHFMKEVMKQEGNITPTELLLFSRDKNTRTALIQGLSQLDRSYAMLQQCVDYQRTMS